MCIQPVLGLIALLCLSLMQRRWSHHGCHVRCLHNAATFQGVPLPLSAPVLGVHSLPAIVVNELIGSNSVHPGRWLHVNAGKEGADESVGTGASLQASWRWGNENEKMLGRHVQTWTNTTRPDPNDWMSGQVGADLFRESMKSSVESMRPPLAPPMAEARKSRKGGMNRMPWLLSKLPNKWLITGLSLLGVML